MSETKKTNSAAAGRKKGGQTVHKGQSKAGAKMPAARRRGSQSAASKAPKAATPRKTAQQAMKMAQETAKAASEAMKNLSGTLLQQDKKKTSRKSAAKKPAEIFAKE